MVQAAEGGWAGRKLAIVLEYEGTRYHGFQFQSNASSVQAEVEAAVTQLTGETIRVKAAGRTDTGVHAAGQVVAFVTRAPYDVRTFTRALNHYLPDDIGVREACEVPIGFDPRRHAVARVYRYTVLNREARSPLWRRFGYRVPEPLDVGDMHSVLAHLRGTPRDFAPFSGPLGRIKTTVRRVSRTEVWRCGDLVLVEVEGNAFLPQQVRRMVGAVLKVGIGEMSKKEFQRLADCGSRGAAHYVAPSHGLCLIRVRYARVGLKGNYEYHKDV